LRNDNEPGFSTHEFFYNKRIAHQTSCVEIP